MISASMAACQCGNCWVTLGSFLMLVGRVVQRPEAGNWVLEFVGPVQWCQPSLSTSGLKPSGKRGHSPSSEGAPAAPQPQALGPSQGREKCVSQTQPEPSQRGQFMLASPSAV